MTDLPSTTRALVLNKAPGAAAGTINDTTVKDRPVPQLKDGEVLVKIFAAAFNHREVRLHVIDWLGANQAVFIAWK